MNCSNPPDPSTATKTAFTKFEAVILARGGAFQSMEGEGHARNVVIEFPSFAQACACYNSPEYQEAKALREGAGLANITMVEGV